MKKLIIVLLGIIMVAALVACDMSDDSTHDHYGGTATCKQKAVCEECGEEYGELAAHAGGSANCLKGAICDTCGEEYTATDPEKHASKQTEFVANDDGLTHTERHECCKVAIGDPANHHGGDDATCKTKSVCDDCGAEYGDVDPENHEKPDEYIYVDNGDGKHTKKYACCEAEKETVKHSGTATCLNAAYCDECKKSYGDVDPENHEKPDEFIYIDKGDGVHHTTKHACCNAEVGDDEHTVGTAATCNSKAKCGLCKAEYGDVDPTKHVGGTATCTQKAVCDVCKQEYGDLAKHNFTVTDSDETYHWNKCSVCGTKDEESAVKHSVSEWVATEVANTKTGKCSCGYTVATLTENITAEDLTLYTASELAGKTYAHEAAYAPAVTLNGEALSVNVTPEDTAVVNYEGGKLVAAFAGKTTVNVSYNVLGENKTLSFEVIVVRPIAVYDTAIKYFSAIDGEMEELSSLFGSDTVTEAKQTYNGTDYPLTVDENGALKGAFAEVKKPTVCTITVATATYGYTFNVTAYTKVITDYTDFEDMRLTADKKTVEGYFILNADIDLWNADINGNGTKCSADGNDTFYPYNGGSKDMLTVVNDNTRADAAAGFIGTFDGNGHTITGFRAGNSYGFFGTICGKRTDGPTVIEYTVIKNVAFLNTHIFWTSWTGGKMFAEYAAYTQVENVYIQFVRDNINASTDNKNFALFGSQDSPYVKMKNVVVNYDMTFSTDTLASSSGSAVGIFTGAANTNYYAGAGNTSSIGYMLQGSIEGLYVIAPKAENGRVMPLVQHGNYTQNSSTGKWDLSGSMTIYAVNDFVDLGEKSMVTLDETTRNPILAESGTNYVYHWKNAYRYDTLAAMAEEGTTQVGNWDISGGSPVWKA